MENYRHLRELVDEWVTLAGELSQLRMLERRALQKKKTVPKRAIPKKKPN